MLEAHHILTGTSTRSKIRGSSIGAVEETTLAAASTLAATLTARTPPPELFNGSKLAVAKPARYSGATAIL